MGDEDDIAAALPRPPLPAPARREAAIEQAMRRFDGAAEGPARAGGEARGTRPPIWSAPRRSYAGALAGALLVALIGLPWVWTLERPVPDGGRAPPPVVEATGPGPAMADAEAPEMESGPPVRRAETSADGVSRRAPEDFARADPSPVVAPKADEAPAVSSQEPAPAGAAGENDQIVVTGTRIARPNLTSSSPVTVVGDLGESSARSARAAPSRRGDWNACTIDDPGRSLAACRKSADPATAAAQLDDGLSRAWEGDLDSAIASFDRAIELAPRSSAAYLNRALAWRRRGDLDRALADLDRAVRYSPRAARYYYHRSLVLRQRGDDRRARADEERAVALDPRYGVAVRGGE